MDPFAELPRRQFRAVVADPPWAFRSYAPPNKNPRSRRDVDRHYATMNGSDIEALPVKSLCDPEGAHLFLWVTGPNLPAGLRTMEKWGFRYSGMAFVWIKLKASFNANQLRVLPSNESDLAVGLGFTTRKNAEFCLLGRYGNAKRNAKDVREVIMSPRREHSRKPDDALARIERYCDGPYLNLFARQQRDGWTAWGNETGKFK